jgi:hypothetical protein
VKIISNTLQHPSAKRQVKREAGSLLGRTSESLPMLARRGSLCGDGDGRREVDWTNPGAAEVVERRPMALTRVRSLD